MLWTKLTWRCGSTPKRSCWPARYGWPRGRIRISFFRKERVTVMEVEDLQVSVPASRMGYLMALEVMQALSSRIARVAHWLLSQLSDTASMMVCQVHIILPGAQIQRGSLHESKMLWLVWMEHCSSVAISVNTEALQCSSSIAPHSCSPNNTHHYLKDNGKLVAIGCYRLSIQLQHLSPSFIYMKQSSKVGH